MSDATQSQDLILPRRSFPFVKFMFFLIVIVPTALALTYAIQTKTPLYQSQAQFAIEDRQQGSGMGLSGLMASMGVASGEPNAIYTVRRQSFWHQELRKLGECPAHLVGLIMRRAVCDASVALRVSFV